MHYSFLKVANIGLVNYLPLPNYLKALPNKPFEYMACNLPMVMSNFADWQRIFEECALQLIEEKYSWENESKKLLDVYEELRKE